MAARPAIRDDLVVATEPQWANLRMLLNEWDPIGVADLVDDEYDCLIAPVWSLMAKGADPAELSEFLWFELEDHFGLDPTDHDVDGMANRLAVPAVAWNRSAA